MLEQHLKMIEKSHEWHNQRAIESHRDVLRVFKEMGKISQEEMDKRLEEVVKKINEDHSSCPFLLELQKIKKDYLELRVE